MIWVKKQKKEKDEGLPVNVRKKIAEKVLSRLVNAQDLKACADELSGRLATVLSEDFKGGDGLEYAIGVACGQIKRYIANQVYHRITESRE
jgi:hypothetical protein